jgi:hypothetical protein
MAINMLRIGTIVNTQHPATLPARDPGGQVVFVTPQSTPQAGHQGRSSEDPFSRPV